MASPNQSEIRLTLETTVELVNASVAADFDPRSTLEAAGFTRADRASEASIQRLRSRIAGLSAIVRALPDLDVADASALVNEQLTELPIRPSIVDHGGVGPHLHWTPATATFDDQVISDIAMALASELCDNGTSRFGVCAADGCDRMFYDSTRNRSKRFCTDPRCASRTHTADHRARRRR